MPASEEQQQSVEGDARRGDSIETTLTNDDMVSTPEMSRLTLHSEDSEPNIIVKTPSQKSRQPLSPYSTIRAQVRQTYGMESSLEGNASLETPKQRKGKGNPLLHRVLDSNWRLAQSPHVGLSSPMSSPHLTTTILSSPLKQQKHVQVQPRTPGFDSDGYSSDIGLPSGMSPPVTIGFGDPLINRSPLKGLERKDI